MKKFIFILVLFQGAFQVNASDSPLAITLSRKDILHHKYKLLNASQGLTIHLVRGDILDINADAIVNPANPSLRHLGGLCGKIHDAAGAKLEKECLTLPVVQDGDIRCMTGDAVVTEAYDLKKCKYVIHAVGPVWNKKDPLKQAQKLENAYKKSLELAGKNNLNSIALSAISAGIYGYPIEQQAQVAVKTVLENYRLFAAPHENKDIYFVLFSQEHFDAYEKALNDNGHLVAKASNASQVVRSVPVFATDTQVNYPKRGEIYWVKMDPVVGTEMAKTRPAIVVSNNQANQKSHRVVVVPITSNEQLRLASHVPIQVQNKVGKVVVDQLKSVDKERLGKKIGECSKEIMSKVDQAIKMELALI